MTISRTDGGRKYDDAFRSEATVWVSTWVPDLYQITFTGTTHKFPNKRYNYTIVLRIN